MRCAGSFIVGLRHMILVFVFSSVVRAQLPQAATAFRAERHDEVVRLLEPYVRLKPTDAAAHRLLGQSLASLGRDDDAYRHLVRAVANGRPDDDVLTQLARLDQRAKRWSEAAAWLRLALVVTEETNAKEAKSGIAPPTSATQLRRRLQLALADSLFAGGDVRGSLDVYRGLVTSPTPADLHLRFGLALAAAGETTAAVRRLETAWHLMAKPSVDIARQIVDLHRRRGDRRSALRWTDRVLAQSDLDVDEAHETRLRRARLLMDLDRLEEADVALAKLEDDVKSTAEEHRDDDDDDDNEVESMAAKVLRLRGYVGLRLGRRDDAVAVWTRAVEAGSTDATILGYLGRRHARAERWAKAVEFLERRRDVGGPDEDHDRVLVVALIRTNKTDRAREFLVDWVKTFGWTDDVEALLASLHRSMK